MGDHVVWINATGGLSSTTMTNVASGRPVSASTLADPLSRLVSTGRSGSSPSVQGRVGLVDLGNAALEPMARRPPNLGVQPDRESERSCAVSTDGGGGLIFWDLVAGRALSTPISLGTSNGLTAIFSPREGAADLLLVSDAGLALIDGDPEGWEARACRIANRESDDRRVGPVRRLRASLHERLPRTADLIVTRAGVGGSSRGPHTLDTACGGVTASGERSSSACGITVSRWLGRPRVFGRRHVGVDGHCSRHCARGGRGGRGRRRPRPRRVRPPRPRAPGAAHRRCPDLRGPNNVNTCRIRATP